ncbi:MAG: tetratricopeptide repeat protein [Bryobacteraceae bacterium]
MRAFLLDLGRTWKQQGRPEEASSALLAASRGAESRVAEAARELLPARYPYVYEFEAAVKLDPGNVALRRELAYLLLQMGKKSEAEAQFLGITELDPTDRLSAAQLGFLRLNRNEVASAMPLLERLLKGEDDDIADRIREALKMPKTLRKRPEAPRSQSTNEAKRMAERSLEAGYLKDALKYLRIAHEHDPIDFSVIYKLGSVHNLLKDDAQAIEWFRLARKSPDKKLSSDADRAFRTSGLLWPGYVPGLGPPFSHRDGKTCSPMRR